jgi:aminoglycoside/choline kinase family phosphotransferase/dTDP-glucose pyrophosphorylase
LKALILAAGLGTRLRPYTQHTPKPLFPFGKSPLLDITIRKLIAAGCSAIAVNTHHLGQRIADFIGTQRYPVAVIAFHEPVILGTGGTLSRIRDWWQQGSLMVVNADIVTDLDFKQVIDFHRSHPDPVTLVVTDDPDFNSVHIHKGLVTGFGASENTGTPLCKQTFTGIQIIEPEVLAYIPGGIPASSIDAYRNLIAAGGKIRAYDITGAYWQDLGTAPRYRQAVFRHLATKAFQTAHGIADLPFSDIATTRLHGDGSDRCWYRLSAQGKTLVMVDHGIRTRLSTSEVDAFAAIGSHLRKRRIPVPRIYLSDTFSGLVFVEDLGDTALQDRVGENAHAGGTAGIYREVIGALVAFSRNGIQGFDPAWAYQSAAYDRKLIVERECRYFINAFVKGYLGMSADSPCLEQEFDALACAALQGGVNGLMHRDCQSRNILIKNGRPYFIDFQGARHGPIQYDLASLLIDPYVMLPVALQQELLDYGIGLLCQKMAIDCSAFHRSYRYCCVTRNLQMLGAFGFLTTVKQKPWFERYIPPAAASLTRHIAALGADAVPGLSALVQRILQHLLERNTGLSSHKGAKP